jgi:hypothetical protein
MNNPSAGRLVTGSEELDHELEQLRFFDFQPEGRAIEDQSISDSWAQRSKNAGGSTPAIGIILERSTESDC